MSPWLEDDAATTIYFVKWFLVCGPLKDKLRNRYEGVHGENEIGETNVRKENCLSFAMK